MSPRFPPRSQRCSARWRRWGWSAASASGARSLFSGMLYAPLVMPEVISGLSLLLLFVALNAERGFWTVTIAHTTLTMCFVTVVVQSRLASLDRSLEEAAMDLGCDPVQAFLAVTLPLIIPAIAAGWMLAFTLSLDDVVIASFTTGPGSATLPIRIYSEVRLGVKPEINAICTMVIALIAVVIVIASLASKLSSSQGRERGAAVRAASHFRKALTLQVPEAQVLEGLAAAITKSCGKILSKRAPFHTPSLSLQLKNDRVPIWKSFRKFLSASRIFSPVFSPSSGEFIMAKSKKVLDKSSSSRPETHRICNVVPSRNTETDWAAEDAIAAGAAAAPLAAPPASVDLRQHLVGHRQSGSTGSCVGWGSTDGVARYHFVKAGRLAQNAKLSPRFTWMASKETDEFTSRPETMIEGRRHQPEGGGGDPAEIRRGAGDAAALPHPDQHVSGQRERILTPPRRRARSPPTSTCSAIWRAGDRGWQAMGPILVALNVGPDLQDNATATQGKLDTFMPVDHSRRPLRLLCPDIPPTAASSSATVGVRPGRQGLCLCQRGLYQCRILQRELRRDDLRRGA